MSNSFTTSLRLPASATLLEEINLAGRRFFGHTECGPNDFSTTMQRAVPVPSTLSSYVWSETPLSDGLMIVADRTSATFGQIRRKRRVDFCTSKIDKCSLTVYTATRQPRASCQVYSSTVFRLQHGMWLLLCGQYLVDFYQSYKFPMKYVLSMFALFLLLIVPSVSFGSITISPTSLPFGPQSIGTSSLTQYVTITFTFPHSIPSYSSMMIRGPHAAEFNYAGGCTPGPGSPGSCRIGIWFQPRSEGTKTADFVFDVSGVVPLTGTGSVGLLNPNHTILAFPQFANGLGIISELTVVNSSLFPAEGEILLNGDDGNTIDSSALNHKRFVLPKYGVSVFQETPINHGFTIGSLRLRFPSVDKNSPPSAVLKITIPGLGSAATGPSPIGPSFNLPVRRIVGAERDVLFNTGIAITSFSPRTQTISLNAYTDNGNLLASTQLQLPPNGHKAAFIEELLPSEAWHGIGDHIAGLVIKMTDRVDWQDQISVVGFQIGRLPGQFTLVPPTPLRVE